MLRVTKSKHSGHCLLVSAIAFRSLALIVPFVLSTSPALWGWYAQCLFKSIFNCCPTLSSTSFTKCEPLSDLIICGTPNVGIILLHNAFATVRASGVELGNTSTHLENASIITKQYSSPLALLSWI